MAGRIGPVQRAQDGQTYGFVVYDEAGPGLRECHSGDLPVTLVVRI